MLKIPDNEAIGLFINFYKLLFLGTDFAKKMLKIQIENTGTGDKASANFVIDSGKGDTDGEMSDGKFINDTDIASSDWNDVDPMVDHSGAVKVGGDMDPYQKIKLHANLAL